MADKRKKRGNKKLKLESEAPPISLDELYDRTTKYVIESDNPEDSVELTRVWGDQYEEASKEQKAFDTARRLYNGIYPNGSRPTLNNNSILKMRARATRSADVVKQVQRLIDHNEPQSDNEDEDESDVDETDSIRRLYSRRGRVIKPVKRLGNFVRLDKRVNLELNPNRMDGKKNRTVVYKRIGEIASDQNHPDRDDLIGLQEDCNDRKKQSCLSRHSVYQPKNVCAWKKLNIKGASRFEKNIAGKCVLDPLAVHNFLAKKDPNRGWSVTDFRLRRNKVHGYARDNRTTYRFKPIESLQQDEFPYQDETPSRFERSNFSSAYPDFADYK